MSKNAWRQTPALPLLPGHVMLFSHRHFANVPMPFLVFSECVSFPIRCWCLPVWLSHCYYLVWRLTFSLGYLVDTCVGEVAALSRLLKIILEFYKSQSNESGPVSCHMFISSFLLRNLWLLKILHSYVTKLCNSCLVRLCLFVQTDSRLGHICCRKSFKSGVCMSPLKLQLRIRLLC